MTVRELAALLSGLPEEKQGMGIFIQEEAPIQPDFSEVERIETMYLYEGDERVETLVLRGETWDRLFGVKS